MPDYLLPLLSIAITVHVIAIVQNGEHYLERNPACVYKVVNKLWHRNTRHHQSFVQQLHYLSWFLILRVIALEYSHDILNEVDLYMN